ncbi:MAG: GH92 family glycosyl hydrolase, partial [Pseudobdellovibrionaceae bacterium]|nr:GH92 family glycosyl hydrolase [Pseudobdellovibrionaceae bacterium]
MKLFFLIFSLFVATHTHAEEIDYTSLVNPFIGTSKDGTTYPGAVAPFGMLQWSPDTGDRIGGYLYEDTKIRGFSLYRVSGTGGLHGQDLPFMPTFGRLDRSPVYHKYAYASNFSHTNERASPGQYQVHLDDTGIDVDLAVTTRSGIGSFHFPAGRDAAMVLYPTGRIGEVYESRFVIDPSQRKISGYSFGSGADNGYALYVVAEFDQDFSSFGFWRGEERLDGLKEAVGKDIAAWLRFDTSHQQRVQMRVGISYVSLANAEENLRAEISDWNQAALKEKTRSAWNSILSRIAVKGGTHDQRVMFYTALYHASLNPNIFNDVNGQYMDMDDKVQTIEPGHNKYVNYSLWDVYRTIPQLQALLQPAITSDMVRSLLLDSQQCQGGGLPIFGVLNSAPGIMCGYPADPFMASAFAFGARDFDVKAVHQKMVETAMNQMPCGPNGGAWWHQDDYKKGYVAHESTEWGSISYNIEYAVADFAVAMMSAAVGDQAQYDYFLRRSQNWRNLFNPAVGFMQERYRNGTWVPHFSPTGTEGYMEGNAIQQSLMVPHNIAGVLNQTQKHHPIEPQLDRFFSQILTSGWPTDQPYYWAGNEPMIGMPWYYNWLQKPWKTQEIVSRAREQAFTNKPDGLPGNDDLGTMSAWYIFAALGLYPEIPGVAVFSLHAPLFPEARITLGDGRTLDIRTDAADTRNLYIQSLDVNGTPHSSTWLPLDKLLTQNHNTLVYALGPSTHSSWGTAPEDTPPSFDERGENSQRVHGMEATGFGTSKESFDRDIQTFAKSRQLSYTYPSVTPVNAYTITAGWEAAQLRSWRVLGTHDGVTWVTLD